ncbi:GLC7-interacting protein 2 [Nakaseomyces bracarensis]|uniref:GLC7-interacting protein 2 n=1 Tax=Nakaseomyces bracarensis TaxID=273131 RepID=A0ABR4NX61_9SACH
MTNNDMRRREEESPFTKNFTIHEKVVPRPFGDDTFTITKTTNENQYVKTPLADDRNGKLNGNPNTNTTTNTNHNKSTAQKQKQQQKQNKSKNNNEPSNIPKQNLNRNVSNTSNTNTPRDTTADKIRSERSTTKTVNNRSKSGSKNKSAQGKRKSDLFKSNPLNDVGIGITKRASELIAPEHIKKASELIASTEKESIKKANNLLFNDTRKKSNDSVSKNLDSTNNKVVSTNKNADSIKNNKVDTTNDNKVDTTKDNKVNSTKHTDNPMMQNQGSIGNETNSIGKNENSSAKEETSKVLHGSSKPDILKANISEKDTTIVKEDTKNQEEPKIEMGEQALSEKSSDSKDAKPDVPIITPTTLPATALLKNQDDKENWSPIQQESNSSSNDFDKEGWSPVQKESNNTSTEFFDENMDISRVQFRTIREHMPNTTKDNEPNKYSISESNLDKNDLPSIRPLSYPVYNNTSNETGNIIKDVPSTLINKSRVYSRNASINSGRKNVFGPMPGSHGRVNSLDFLHKPQRVTQLRDDTISPEELQRNTNMNKKITLEGAFPFDNPDFNNINQNSMSGDRSPIDVSPEAETAFNRSYNAVKTDAIIEMTQDDAISPTEKSYPVLNKTNQQNDNAVIANKNNVGTFDDPYDAIPVEDYMMPLPPVYKRSGELVKSSLKRRSKSLPVTPNSNSRLNLKVNEANDNLRTNLTRSKSVHFDQRLPVKYFFKEESPNVVSIRDEEDDVLSFQHKPLQRSVDIQKGKKRLDLSRQLEDGFGATDLDMLIDDDDDDEDDENSFGDGDTIFGRGLKSLMINDRSSMKNNFKDPPTKKKDQSRERTFGIQNKNFPVLGSKNPRSLKLNIFMNSSQEKKVFLQEISFNAQKRNNTGYNNQSTSAFGEDDNDEKLIITGSILVKNIYFSKKVLVRYTWDHWRSSSEVESMYVGSGNSYLPGSNMDIFRFVIDNTILANGLYVSNKSKELEFCICYITRASDDSAREEYWDNNNGKNYIIEMLRRPT